MNNHFIITRETKFVLAAWIATGLLLVSLSAGTFMITHNKGLTETIRTEKLKTEKLLAEKAALEKEIKKLKESLLNLQDENKEANRALAAASHKLKEKEKEVIGLSGKNTLTRSLEKQLDGLHKTIDGLKNQLKSMAAENQHLKDENVLLGETNSVMKAETQRLGEKPNYANVYRVDALGKKEKLTVKAKRTKKINFSFDLPAALSLPDNSKLLYVIMTAPGGKIITSEGKGKTLVSLKQARQETAITAVKVVDRGTQSQRVNISFEPKEKLIAGIYTIDLYSENGFIGTVQLRLA